MSDGGVGKIYTLDGSHAQLRLVGFHFALQITFGAKTV